MFGGENTIPTVKHDTGSCCKVSQWNNDEGGLTPNSLGKPSIISQKIGTWVQLGVLMGHTCIKSGKGMVNQARIEVLEWSFQSPDLNPGKNMWSVLKNQIHARKLTNLVELHLFNKDEWLKFQPEDY